MLIAQFGVEEAVGGTNRQRMPRARNLGEGSTYDPKAPLTPSWDRAFPPSEAHGSAAVSDEDAIAAALAGGDFSASREG